MENLLIQQLKGPILVLGASGFIGANLFRKLSSCRSDVYGTASSLPVWRLNDLQETVRDKIIACDLRAEIHLRDLFQTVKPQTVFNCLAFGAYSYENDPVRIYDTNIMITLKILLLLESQGVASYVHAGSSSEYGDNCAGPLENSFPECNSFYSVTKLSGAHLIQYYGRHKKMPVCNLRLYSVYGPYEDSSRLIPNLVKKGIEGSYPPLVKRNISRDYVYVDDVFASFVHAALYLQPEYYGSSFNIGSGEKTTIESLARLAKETFAIPFDASFGDMEPRDWDLADWYSNPQLAEKAIHWKAKVSLQEGLAKTRAWIEALPDWADYQRSSKKNKASVTHSVSAIIACYKDSQAIPYMYKRLTETFRKINVDYEIIFVNDNSPDDTEQIIKEISQKDPHVIGVSHSRNFGSQAAFKSGMDIATKNSCVLLDGDLQDPPELIEQFVEKWKMGYDVVYGRRVKRVAPRHMQLAYKAFYRIFDYFSYLPIPHDAGDFSLIDRKVMLWLLAFPERDLFLRGIRAYAGFKQTGVDYVRPERMFGRTTNSLLKNINWAKKALFSFSYAPLNLLSFAGIAMVCITGILSVIHVLVKVFYPEFAPQGITTVLLLIAFFGSFNLVGISLVGEYIAKIFEETKGRPVFIRRGIIRDGEVKPVQCVLTPQSGK